MGFPQWIMVALAFVNTILALAFDQKTADPSPALVFFIQVVKWVVIFLILYWGGFFGCVAR